MATGFIYTVMTLTKEYVQKAFCCVPTEFGDRIYFGPCKIPMRPRVKPGDYVFGLSPAKVGLRRIVFVGHIKKRITFREAYERFPELHGSEGPIHVRPIHGSGSFPRCSYAHIPKAIHEDKWENDLASRDLDAFFVCSRRDGCVGRWLGRFGTEVDEETLDFLKTCSVHGISGMLSPRAKDATLRNPIAHGKLYRGLHLETSEPKTLVALCKTRMASAIDHLARVSVPTRGDTRRPSCGGCRPSRACG